MNDYLEEWNPRRAQHAEEATDRYLGRHPVWGESCDQIGTKTVIPGWKVARERQVAAMEERTKKAIWGRAHQRAWIHRTRGTFRSDAPVMEDGND